MRRRRRSASLGGFGKALGVAGSIWPLAALASASNTGESNVLAFRNRSGQTLDHIYVDYANYYLQQTGESVTSLDTVIVSSAVQTTSKAGSRYTALNEVEIAPNEIYTGMATGFSIAPDEVFYVRTDVRPKSGGRYPIAHVGAGTISTDDREVEVYTGTVSQKAISGTINGTSTGCYSPAGIRSKTPNRFSLGVVGDSWVQGAGDGTITEDVSTGFAGRATTGIAPYMAMGYTGAEAAHNRSAAALQNRLVLAGLACSHVLVEFGINDAVNGNDAATIRDHILEIAGRFKGVGCKTIGMTIGPRSSSTDSWVTEGNQTANATALSITPALNGYLRAQPAPYIDVFDAADILMPSRDSVTWKTRPYFIIPQYTNDGLHPVISSDGSAVGELAAALKEIILPLMGQPSQYADENILYGSWASGHANTTLSTAGGKARATSTSTTAVRISKQVTGLVPGIKYLVQSNTYAGTLSGNNFFRVSSTQPLSSGDYLNSSSASDQTIEDFFIAPEGGSVYVGIVGVVNASGQYCETDEDFTITRLF